jgi:hypothetical protein
MRFLVSFVAVVMFASSARATDPVQLTAELNAVRAAHGLPPVATDPGLCATCQSWSSHLAATGRFHHGGGDHIIARGQSSAREVIQSWMNSPGHRSWLLSANASVGWGVALGRDGTYTWAGAFGGVGGECANGVCGGGTGAVVGAGFGHYRAHQTTTMRTRFRERMTDRPRLFGRRR